MIFFRCVVVACCGAAMVFFFPWTRRRAERKMEEEEKEKRRALFRNRSIVWVLFKNLPLKSSKNKLFRHFGFDCGICFQ